jgi:hypothetical protein
MHEYTYKIITNNVDIMESLHKGMQELFNNKVTSTLIVSKGQYAKDSETRTIINTEKMFNEYKDTLRKKLLEDSSLDVHERALIINAFATVPFMQGLPGT